MDFVGGERERRKLFFNFNNSQASRHLKKIPDLLCPEIRFASAQSPQSLCVAL